MRGRSGFWNAERKYGKCGGKLQEQEGPPEAEQLLRRLGFPEGENARICYLVGHHHTYQDIEGMDYQILVEADFLVNLFEDHSERKAVETAVSRIFRTNAGRRVCQKMFLEEPDE